MKIAGPAAEKRPRPHGRHPEDAGEDDGDVRLLRLIQRITSTSILTRFFSIRSILPSRAAAVDRPFLLRTDSWAGQIYPMHIHGRIRGGRRHPWWLKNGQGSLGSDAA